ncbi:HTTM domain-containing protein [Flavobacterium psychrotrophum]|uniref:HTTM domain-containing protein n=1 Tax=Flavobacterium psychrotrophum TaxID=2294119 RepID=UPI000E315112|nr:HTTM domain-containing protein [Flavobacterium psychrotrophum]
MHQKIKSYLNSDTDAASLAFYRLAFGIMMFLGMVRFALNGWIDKFYIKPVFHFTYYGFGWVKPFGYATYGLFVVCAVAALMVAFGYKYRLGIILFFLSFTYIELMDKTTYLNHYYFISVMSFVLIFLPANVFFSADAKNNPQLHSETVPRYTVDVLKILLGIVYFYAGLAKLNSDWLIDAMPLKIWLTSNTHLPIIGPLLGKEWVAYAFSYIGAVYDLFIVFLLLNRRTRWFAFILVVVFHVLTRILFPIGIFPFVMIVSSLVFFSSGFHRRILFFVQDLWFRVNTSLLRRAAVFPHPQPLSEGEGSSFTQAAAESAILESNSTTNNAQQSASEIRQNPRLRSISEIRVPKIEGKLPTTYNQQPTNRLIPAFLALFILFQLIFPFRYLAYPQELFWSEEGFRFSWRVMLMEKAGYTQFKVTDSITGKTIYINNHEHLTAFQEKQMSFQPDFILEYAHYLHDLYARKGMADPAVYADSYVALNGRLSTRYIDPKVNLAKQDESFSHKTWILPFKDTITGF